MTVYGYVRISTEMQDHDSQKAAISRSHKIDMWVEDTGTGRITQPNLFHLSQQCNEKDTIIVSAFDRLGRNTASVISMVKFFQRKGTSLVSIREGVDLSSASGNMVFQMMCSIAEYESLVIADRVTHGLRAAKARGVILGPPRIADSENGRQAIMLAKEFRAKGFTLRQIQGALKGHKFSISSGTLSKLFRKEKKV